MELTQKGVMVERLQVKASSIGRILTNLEKKYHNTHDRDEAMKKSPSGHSLGHRKQIVTIQRIPAFNPNKIRKSPSSEAKAVVAQEEIEKEPRELEDVDEGKNPEE